MIYGRKFRANSCLGKNSGLCKAIARLAPAEEDGVPLVQMLHDYFVLYNTREGPTFPALRDLNAIDVSFYINDHYNPNLQLVGVPDNDFLEFQAARPIRAGDQLLQRYAPESDHLRCSIASLLLSMSHTQTALG
eukprot:SAG31_NODE_569_length_14020_cov_11.049565_6_plen_134_part_00